MIRIILKLKKEEGDRKSFSELPNGQKRYLLDLMSHRTEIEKDSETRQNFEVIFRTELRIPTNWEFLKNCNSTTVESRFIIHLL